MTREEAHKGMDETVTLMMNGLKRENYRTDNDWVVTVNFLDKVYRPFLHVITDAEFDDIDPACVTTGVVELCVSICTQMATRIVPDGDRHFANEWFKTVSGQIAIGNANSFQAIWPPQHFKADTVQ